MSWTSCMELENKDIRAKIAAVNKEMGIDFSVLYDNEDDSDSDEESGEYDTND